MPLDPNTAPVRTDLPWLRHRGRPKPAQPTPVAPALALSDFISGRARRPGRDPSPPPTPARTPAPAAPTLTSSPRSPSPSLDLDEPAAPSPPPPPVRPPTSSLDLDEAPSQPVPPRPARAAPVVSAPSGAPLQRRRIDERVRANERVLLTPIAPTVTLDRLQSAIGTLTVEAACSAEVGDLRLGCVYELFSGTSSTVQLTQGNRAAPPRSRRPVILAGRDRFERLAVDLRQCTDLRRLVVYAFSEARVPLAWGGTLVATTFGGGRVELPLDTLQSGDVGVLMSLYNVRGEFVLRAEMQTLFGEVREAARSYGFDRISWLDDRTPVD